MSLVLAAGPGKGLLPQGTSALARRAGRGLRAALLGLVSILWLSTAFAQEPTAVKSETTSVAATTRPELSPAPAKVDVKPLARDEEIRKRLQSILVATEWFDDPQVRVEEGVVFLKGRAGSEDLKHWAGDLARNTQDVVAVVNRMELPTPSVWDLSPVAKGFLTLQRDFVRSLPLILAGVLILALSVGAGVLTSKSARVFLASRLRARLLRNVIAGTAGVLVVLFGAYVILRVAGLTQLALTLVGGTGLIGLAFGIAFREITENFLASIFLSVQSPFETTDLVEVAGVTGYVQQLNMRTTILMDLDGNLVQVPNANVYKSNLRNFTANANRRENFVVGIGYDDEIDRAQEIALEVLSEHPAVLADPEPLVLADSLGSSTVNLRIYFWLDGREHSWLKVRSSVIRLVKRSFQKKGISMPDQAREVVFPRGVPVTMLDGTTGATRGESAGKRSPADRPPDDSAAVATKAEAGLYSEADVLEKQARQAQPLRRSKNLLPEASDDEGVES